MNTLEELEIEQEARRELGSRTRPGPREDLVVRYLAAVDGTVPS